MDEMLRTVDVGGLARSQLIHELAGHGILINRHAETLLAGSAFDTGASRRIIIAERTVAQLGLHDGAVLPQVFAAARNRGYLLCPPATGPYLALSIARRRSRPAGLRRGAPAPPMSTGQAPADAITIASMPPREDHDRPKGFYMRTVEGQQWLRGYRCDDEHLWSPEDRFLVRLET